VTCRPSSRYLAEVTIHGEKETTRKPIPIGTRQYLRVTRAPQVVDANRSMKRRNETAKRLPAAKANRMMNVVELKAAG
jgi:hypothetical protein